MVEIVYRDQKELWAYGRNGSVRQRGISARLIDGVIRLNVLTGRSQSAVSDAVKMMIPIEDAHDVAVALMDFVLHPKMEGG